MMDRMHESERYGYLCVNGEPMTEDTIARLCGTTVEEFRALFAELTRMGVPRITSSGIIFCKRMVEDEKKRLQWRQWQSKSRKASTNNNIRGPDVRPLSGQCQGVLHSAFAVAVASKNKNQKPPPSAEEFPETPVWVPEDAWRAYVEMRGMKRAKITAKAALMIFQKLRAWMEKGQDPREVLEQSVMNGWTGIFEVKNGTRQRINRPSGAVAPKEGKQYKQPVTLAVQ